MRYENLEKSDLNLLLSFQALMEERSVTGAARRRFLSQPAMSRAVARLRAMFKDELFVRTARGLTPTHRASEIYEELQQVLPRINGLFGATRFDPAKVHDLFRIESSDWGATVLIPSLIKILAREAPGIQIAVIPARIGLERLEANEVDLILTPRLPSGSQINNPNLRTEALLREEIVCLVRAGHKLAKHGITLREYAKAKHISLSPMQGRGHTSLMEAQPAVVQALKQLGQKLDVRVEIPYFVPLSRIVETTDLVASVPLQIARHFRSPKVRIVSAPREFQPYSYDQVWHSRNEESPVHRWLRGVVREIAKRVA